MKILVIGDIHGYPSWKKVTKHETYDKVVFIGDYFDSFHNKADQQIKNFKEIYEFYLANPKNVVLLCGNHDFHYLKGANDYYSGFQRHAQHAIGEVLEEAIKNKAIQICFVYKEFVITHAGITKTWCINNSIDYKDSLENIEATLNELFYYRPSAFGFSPGKYMDAYGDEFTQSPLWVRPRSLILDRIDAIHIVGHTERPAIERIENVELVVAMGDGEYLTIVDDKLFTNRIVGKKHEIKSQKLDQ